MTAPHPNANPWPPADNGGSQSPWADRHATTIAIATTIFIYAYFFLPVFLQPPPDLTDGTGQIGLHGNIWLLFSAAFNLIVVVVFVGLLGWFATIGFTRRIHPAGKTPFYITSAWPLTLAAIMCAAALRDGDPTYVPGAIAAFAALHLLIAIFEEMVFRGILFHGFAKRLPMLVVILLTSILFGFLHFVNIGVGQSAHLTLFQVIHATTMGIFLAGLRIRTQSILPPIIFHFGWNVMVASASLTPDPPTDGQNVLLNPAAYIYPAVFICLGFWLYRRWMTDVDI